MINPLTPARPDLASLRKLHADRIALRWEQYYAPACVLYIYCVNEQHGEVHYADPPTALREFRILHSMRAVQALSRGLRWKTIVRSTLDLDSPLLPVEKFNGTLDSLARRVAAGKAKFVHTPLRRTLHARKH